MLTSDCVVTKRNAPVAFSRHRDYPWTMRALELAYSEGEAMHKPRALTIVLMASGLVLAPMSNALAGGPHWAHGSYHGWHGGGGHWHGGVWWPAAAAAAVVGTAAALVAAPFVAIGNAVTYPAYAPPPPSYGPPQYYAPQVVQAKIVSEQGDRYQVVMRVKQHHVITVVMDTAYDVTFEHPVVPHTDAKRGYSISHSTRISEIESPGTPKEHALTPAEDHGFLWRLNTYWSYEERDGGLYMQIESASLTRAIPTGLGWVVGPFVESVPRESLEFTLRSTSDALKK